MESQATYGPHTLAAVTEQVVGRRRELELVVAALMAGRHLLLEGPPGTGKSTILRSVAAASSQGFSFVEGNAELTPARLTGHFDPAQVLASGYGPDVWIDGPLVTAMRMGGLLYIEELNRIPEETLNVLVTVMSEGELTVPRLGTVTAHTDFRLVAAMNPFDSVGTARIAGAIYDRVCRIAVLYQSHEDEVAIASSTATGVDPAYADAAVRLVRATRDHRDVAVGSSVRGAVDHLLVSRDLASLRNLPADDFELGLDAAQLALSGRIRLTDGCRRTPEDVITELWNELMTPQAVPEDREQSSDGGSSGKDPRRGAAAPMTPATPISPTETTIGS